MNEARFGPRYNLNACLCSPMIRRLDVEFDDTEIFDFHSHEWH